MGNPGHHRRRPHPARQAQGLAGRRAPRRAARLRAARGARARPGSTPSWSSRSSAAASPRPASSPTTWSAAPGCTRDSPQHTGATTIDAQCGSGQQAAHLVNDMINAGTIEVGIACGVESMSRIPLGANVPPGHRRPAAGRLDDRHAQPVRGRRPDRQQPRPHPRRPRGVRPRVAAEGARRRRRGPLQARDRRRSRRRCSTRTASRPARPASSTPTRACATPRSRGWPGCKTVLPDGLHTAGTSSQISDGASAVLIMDSDRAARPRPDAAGPDRRPLPGRLGPVLPPRRPDRGDREGARPHRHDDLRLRPVRGQRGVRVRRPLLGRPAPASTWTGSTSTAARSPSATRSARPAPG